MFAFRRNSCLKFWNYPFSTGGTTRDCLWKPEFKPPSLSLPARNESPASPRCVFLVVPMPAGTSGFRPVSSAGLDPSDALLLLWLDNFPLSAISIVALLMYQQPVLRAVPFRRRGCHRLCLPCWNRLTYLAVGFRLLTWPGAAAASCPPSARSVESLNNWAGGGNVTNLSPFWEGTAQKKVLRGTYLTNPLMK